MMRPPATCCASVGDASWSATLLGRPSASVTEYDAKPFPSSAPQRSNLGDRRSGPMSNSGAAGDAGVCSWRSSSWAAQVAVLLVRLGVEPLELLDLHLKRHVLLSQWSELVAQRRDRVRHRDRARVVQLRSDGGGRGVDGAAATVPPKPRVVLGSETDR